MKTVTKELSKVNNGETFKIGYYEFIKFFDNNGKTTAVSKDCLFNSAFGADNNFKESTVLERLENEILPVLAETIGIENICDIETDLTTLDGLKPYEKMTSKISLPTFDFYRNNVDIFDKYKINDWWWLATPESANPHYSPDWIVCVSPVGLIRYYFYFSNFGVRPFLRLVSSISVSCEEE